MDIRNLLRHLQVETNISAIERATGLNRRTILRYRDWASTHDLLTGPLPSLEALQQLLTDTLPFPAPPQTISSVEPYRALVEQLYADGVEGTAILQRLKERGYSGTLSSIYRFLRHLDPKHELPSVRVERHPGEEAQVDFGYAGRMLDPETGSLRKTWAFVMTLAFSRHQFVEFVFDQSLPTWITLHQHAFNSDHRDLVPRSLFAEEMPFRQFIRVSVEEAQETAQDDVEQAGSRIARRTPRFRPRQAARTRTRTSGRTRSRGELSRRQANPKNAA